MLIKKDARFNPKVDERDRGLEKLRMYASFVRSLGFKKSVDDNDNRNFKYTISHEDTNVTLQFTRANDLKLRPFIYEKFDMYVNGKRKVKNVRTPSIKIRTKIIHLLKKYAPEILLK